MVFSVRGVSEEIQRAVKVRSAETGEAMGKIVDRALRRELGLVKQTLDVVIIGVGDDYTEELERMAIDVSADEDEAAVQEAIRRVQEETEYFVLTDDEGGHCTVADDGEGDYIAITVDAEAYAVDVHKVATVEDEDGHTTTDHSADWVLVDTITGPTKDHVLREAIARYGDDDHSVGTPRRS